MIVYRLEKNGIGPFTQGTGFLLLKKANKKAERKREVIMSSFEYADYNLRKQITHTHVFGCPDKTALRAYFRGNFKQYFKLGYRIKRYVVPDDEVIVMGYEVAFPVKYHKFQSRGALINAVDQTQGLKWLQLPIPVKPLR